MFLSLACLMVSGQPSKPRSRSYPFHQRSLARSQSNSHGHYGGGYGGYGGYEKPSAKKQLFKELIEIPKGIAIGK